MNYAARGSVPLAALLLASCSVHHNVPLADNPNHVTSERGASAFVDQNGTFYPEGWAARYGPPPSSGRHSAWAINTIAHDRLDGALDSLHADEASMLSRFASFLLPKKRVFILIHGFNSSQSESDSSYQLIEDAITFRENDAVIRFYWDGMVASTRLGAPTVWFNSTGYSQMAGIRGLRRLLNQMHGKDVFVIAHSRGASVTLSALSDPPFSADFAQKTLQWHYLDVYQNEPLQNNGNRIRAIFLAPAIGAVDFRSQDYPADQGWRDFGSQLRQLHHTVNPGDPVLFKIVGAPDTFNPTDLGLRLSVAEEIATHYPLMTHDCLVMRTHAFSAYVQSPVFARMLRAVGVETRAPAADGPSPEEACRNLPPR